MVSILEDKGGYMEFAGLSTDNKPTPDGLATGSVFIEVNTGKVFMFNSAAESWVEVQ